MMCCSRSCRGVYRIITHVPALLVCCSQTPNCDISSSERMHPAVLEIETEMCQDRVPLTDLSVLSVQSVPEPLTLELLTTIVQQAHKI